MALRKVYPLVTRHPSSHHLHLQHVPRPCRTHTHTQAHAHRQSDTAHQCTAESKTRREKRGVLERNTNMEGTDELQLGPRSA